MIKEFMYFFIFHSLSPIHSLSFSSFAISQSSKRKEKDAKQQLLQEKCIDEIVRQFTMETTAYYAWKNGGAEAPEPNDLVGVFVLAVMFWLFLVLYFRNSRDPVALQIWPAFEWIKKKKKVFFSHFVCCTKTDRGFF